MTRQAVIVVWSKDRKFFQQWTADYKEGAGIEHGKKIARQIGGAYQVIDGSVAIEAEDEDDS